MLTLANWLYAQWITDYIGFIDVQALGHNSVEPMSGHRQRIILCAQEKQFIYILRLCPQDQCICKERAQCTSLTPWSLAPFNKTWALLCESCFQGSSCLIKNNQAGFSAHCSAVVCCAHIVQRCLFSAHKFTQMWKHNNVFHLRPFTSSMLTQVTI